jgi:hypothetical protein
MSETINAYENPEKKLNLQDLKSFEENIESFTINAEEAAQILGVNRSRLSQLTSKGTFPFERRKIETRNRLFYKLSDLLNHQRTQIQGNYHINPYHVETTCKHDLQELDNQPRLPSIEEKEKRNFKGIFTKNLNINKNHTQVSAKVVHLKEVTSRENAETKENILFIKEKIIQQEEVIEKIKHDNVRRENTFLKYIKENSNSISNTQYSIFLLNKEIKILSEFKQSLEFKSKIKSNKEARIKSSWKKKKAKYASKLTTGS